MRWFRTALVAIGLVAISCSHGSHHGLNAYVSAIGGGVEVCRYGANAWETIDTGEGVDFGDSVRVPRDGYLELTYGEGNTMRLDEKTLMYLDNVTDSGGAPAIEAFVKYGTLVSNIDSLPLEYTVYQVRTPEAVAVASGTQFSVTFEPDHRDAEVLVVNGEVWVVRPDSIAAPVVVQSGFVVLAPHGLPLAQPERFGHLRWRQIERVIAPPFPVRRLTFQASGMGPRLPRIARREPLRAAHPVAIVAHRPTPLGPGRPGPAVVDAPRLAVEHPAPRPAIERSSAPVRPHVRPGVAAGPHHAAAAAHHHPAAAHNSAHQHAKPHANPKDRHAKHEPADNAQAGQ